MDIVSYFSEMPTLHRTLVLVGGLTFFSLIESIIPLFSRGYNKTRHTTINILFTVTTIIVNFSLAFILFGASTWVTGHEFGLLYLIPMNGLLFGIIGLLLLDLIGAWFVHWVEHKVEILWKFHVIHHTDQNVDTTTANRHHPGESVVRLIFTIAAVIIVGAPVWMIFLYQTMSVVLTQFNHSNIRMSKKLDDALMWVFCTPNMHRVHHHYRQPYSDTNYGNIFSFWDRMFGTMAIVDNSKLKYGVDTYMNTLDHDDPITMLKLPFKKYRPTPAYPENEKL
jgi:sterol desaturase/sphingolipid hydroxylase (fatty acid hydroxylase superfamily)